RSNPDEKAEPEGRLDDRRRPCENERERRRKVGEHRLHVRHVMLEVAPRDVRRAVAPPCPETIGDAREERRGETETREQNGEQAKPRRADESHEDDGRTRDAGARVRGWAISLCAWRERRRPRGSSRGAS